MSKLVLERDENYEIVDVFQWLRRARWMNKQDQIHGDTFVIDIKRCGIYALLSDVAKKLMEVVSTNQIPEENVKFTIACLSPGVDPAFIEIDQVEENLLGAYFDCPVRDRNEELSHFRWMLLGCVTGVLNLSVNRSSMWAPENIDPDLSLGLWAYRWKGDSLTWSFIEDPDRRTIYRAGYAYVPDDFPDDEELADMFHGKPPIEKLKPDLSKLGFGRNWLVNAKCPMTNPLGQSVAPGMTGIVKVLQRSKSARLHMGVVFENGTYIMEPVGTEMRRYYGDFRPGPWAQEE